MTSDRLALVSASGLSVFRPVFDALTAMGFYNLNPKLIRELQKPQDGRLLKPAGENIASVIGHLERTAPEAMAVIQEYLQTVVPMVHGVERKAIGPMETLEFRQEMAGARHPWRFLAQNMSDGTLRALGVLTALFQGNRDYAPSLIGIEEPETAFHPAPRPRCGRPFIGPPSRHRSSSPATVPTCWMTGASAADAFLAVVSVGRRDPHCGPRPASRTALRDQLFTAGELLRLNQLAPDPEALSAEDRRQPDLFGDCQP